MKLSQLIQKAKKELKSVSPKAYQESLWILSDCLNLPVNQIFLEKNPISSKQEKDFWLKIQKRKKAIPLEYILKEKFFFKHKFYIKESVFIPRLETETLVKWLCKNIPKNKDLKFVDFGAGVGTVALSVLSHFPKSKCHSVEIHQKSIECLLKNSLNFNLQDRLYLLKKEVSKIQAEDLFFSTAPDLITANPPYIDPKDTSLHPEVYLYEPPLALFSDKKGMGHIISWCEKALELLKPNGIYIFEFGWNQKKQIIEFLNKQPKINSYKILSDQLGHPRIALCFKKNS